MPKEPLPIQYRVSSLPKAVQAATVSVPKELTLDWISRLEMAYMALWIPEGMPMLTIRFRVLP